MDEQGATVIPRIDSRGQLCGPSCMSPGALPLAGAVNLKALHGLAHVNNTHSLGTCLTHPRIPLLTEDSEWGFRLWGACPQRHCGTLVFPLYFSYFGHGAKDYHLCVPDKGNRLFLSKELRPQSSSMVALSPVLQGMPVYGFKN